MFEFLWLSYVMYTITILACWLRTMLTPEKEYLSGRVALGASRKAKLCYKRRIKFFEQVKPTVQEWCSNPWYSSFHDVCHLYSL